MSRMQLCLAEFESPTRIKEGMPKIYLFLNPSVPVLIYSDMPENVQSFKRKREREREIEDKRKRKRE